MMPKIRVNIPIIKLPNGCIVTPNIVYYLLFKISNALRIRQTAILLPVYDSQNPPNNKKNTNNEVKR